MNQLMALILIFTGLVILLLLIRLFGAWIFRIDEVIKLQKQMLNEVKKLTSNKSNIISEGFQSTERWE